MTYLFYSILTLDNNYLNNTEHFIKLKNSNKKSSNKLKKWYIPSENLAIDESMVLYTGYHLDRIYSPMKPIKYGIKTYLLTESST